MDELLEVIPNPDENNPSNNEPSINVSESILLSIKKLLGILENDTHFDTDIMIHINSTFTTLLQLGVGPKSGYRITSSENKWTEFIQDDDQLDSVKTYVYLKVKLLFDPPLNSFLVDSFKESIKELEWRLNVATEENE